LRRGIFFFTVVTHKRRSFLTEPIARKCLRTAWEKVRENRPFEVVALCLLPDHIHCIWEMPRDDDDYSIRWSLIKKHFTGLYLAEGGNEDKQSAARERAGYRGVWQKKFWEHRIKNNKDLENHINYIHYNPVKHGYVSDPFLWPFSTVHKYYEPAHCNNRLWNKAKQMVLSSYME
jgi:putative transposase